MARREKIGIALLMLALAVLMIGGSVYLSYTSNPLPELTRQQESMEIQERIQKAMFDMEQRNE